MQRGLVEVGYEVILEVKVVEFGLVLEGGPGQPGDLVGGQVEDVEVGQVEQDAVVQLGDPVVGEVDEGKVGEVVKHLILKENRFFFNRGQETP